MGQPTDRSDSMGWFRRVPPGGGAGVGVDGVDGVWWSLVGV